MPTYTELLLQKRALDQEIAAAREIERPATLELIFAAIDRFGFTPDEIFRQKLIHVDGRTGPLAPLFRDPATGKTWSGRGKRPGWITDENEDRLRIPK